MNDPQTSTAAAMPLQRKATQKKAMLRLAGVVVVAGLAWLAYDYLVSSHYESTDNAYVQADVIQITPQIGGTVAAVLANETDFVKAGQTLVQLDPVDAQVALEQAEAALAQAVRQTRTLYANNATLKAQIALREADVTKARIALASASEDFGRRQAAGGDGAVSREELQHAQQQLDAARAGLVAAQAGVLAAREQLTSNQALTQGTRIEQHPGVQLAVARLREAYLATQRTALRAPVDGYVARRIAQQGQRVAAGTPLMSVIALDKVWVEANFKEVQLRNIRIGQPVSLVADQYGKKVRYQGTVSGLGAGTGAAFALLPAQNATGNWIKVVQRVPVRIALDPQQLAEHPLRVGLSMLAEVDVANTQGKTLMDTARAAEPAPPSSPSNTAADKLVQRVIAANLGETTASGRARAGLSVH